MPTPAMPLPANVLDSLRRGNAVEAIKLLREQRGIGLKEAKDLINASQHHPYANIYGPVKSVLLLHTKNVPTIVHRVLEWPEVEVRTARRAWNGEAAPGATDSPVYQNAARWLNDNSPGSVKYVDHQGRIQLNELNLYENPQPFLREMSASARAVWAALYYVTGLLHAMDGIENENHVVEEFDAAIRQIELAAMILPGNTQIEACLAYISNFRQMRQLKLDSGVERSSSAALEAMERREVVQSFKPIGLLLLLALLVLYSLFR